MKIRCLFAHDRDNQKWVLAECMEHELWAIGQDFRVEDHQQHYSDFRELNVTLDEAEVQHILGTVATIKATVEEEGGED